MLTSDRLKELEKKIKTVISSEGLHCPKFFIITDKDVVRLNLNLYEKEPRELWLDALERRYPEVHEKVANRWVRIGDTDFEILGIDEAVSCRHLRTKDRQGNEWLISLDDLPF